MDSGKLRHQKPSHEDLYTIESAYIGIILIICYEVIFVSILVIGFKRALRLSVNGDLYVDRIAEGS